MDGRIDGWMDGWKDGWTDGWTDGGVVRRRRSDGHGGDGSAQFWSAAAKMAEFRSL